MPESGRTGPAGPGESGRGEAPAHVAYRAGHARRLARSTYIGTLLVLLGAVLFALIVPAEADNRAYAAAPDCPAGTTRADTCRVSAEATVRRKDRDTSGRSTKYYLVLDDRGTGAEHRVRLPSGTALYAGVRPGDRVTATYWRDTVREVRRGEHSATARLSPAHDGRLPGAFAVVLLAFGLGTLWYAWFLRHRPDVPGEALSPAAPVGMIAGALVGGTGFPVVLLAADDVWSGLEFTAWSVLGALPLSALLSWWVVHRMRRGAARLVPAPLVRRRVLTAVVHGDVPYSRAGYGHLVAGEGPPAVTTDPAGRVALIPLPPTLRVRRVRELLRGDPPFAPPRRGEYVVVIECVDGDRTVLVLAGKKDAPFVLGALHALGGD
ncbi:hypothetical protein GTW43_08035 [Streptomyces sp. SID5785]|uniref:hypothetical protein n=1 Tax=Streptomyces sp. SID5785 TaxID=2690309 RepID=UPI0013612367|nr:hypothetical protein [Streptomyces sp. SID5785]MZD05034.1 hypothetical protein [Streptomyces sp. SID5785]